MSIHRMLARGGLVLAAAAIAVAAGCTPNADAEAARVEAVAAEPQPQEITVSAKNYFFVAPDTIESGMTTLRMSNQGEELHHVQLVRLADGHTAAELEAELKANGYKFPDYITWVGGPNASIPGEQALGTLDLEPGNYAIICVIPSSKDGRMHGAKGMVRALTVVASNKPKVPAPVADLEIKLADYDFQMSAQIAAGKRTIRVENVAQQPHELVLVQLQPGKTVEEVLQWLGKEEGPPPGKVIGGATVMEKGGVNYVTADFVPGEYGFICFAEDAKDGKPHFMHGMVKKITVS